ncbi:MAG: hypothetical protein L0Z62_23040 [Gemmataceae bacterium]|nr:hypothetical protein [Gemmataceae bacterium]
MDSDWELPLHVDVDGQVEVETLPRALPVVSAPPWAEAVALPDEPPPHLGVYVLTEFVFCARAGLCAREAAQEEDQEPASPAWGAWSRSYTLDELERALAETFRRFWVLLAVTLLTAVSAMVLKRLHLGFWWLGAWAAGCWYAFGTLQCLLGIVVLAARRRRARAALPVEPDPAAVVPQVVQWWELLQAGFEPLAVQETLLDRDWNLSGRPWRVLRKGSLLIPVWRMKSSNPEIFKQDRVRLSAYCHLVERSMGTAGCSPYGVILFADSYEGTTVPFRPENAQALFTELKRAHQIIHNSQQGVEPAVPSVARICSGCPFGLPRRYVPGQSNYRRAGRVLPVVHAVDAQKRVYHCHCGDRFQWLPRHDQAVAKNLRPGV